MSEEPLHLVVAGSSGFLGSRLVEAARERGHQVTRLVRRPVSTGTDVRESTWDPDDGTADPDVIERADVVVNLAGSPTAGNPHSTRWARAMRESRLQTTSTLAGLIAGSDRKPAFLAGNGISYYGDHGSEEVTEASDSRGAAFLTQLSREWQQATAPAAAAGARVCVLRTAPVLDRRNPPLKQQILLFKAGLGGRLGSGSQYFPAISARDWVAAVLLLAEGEVSGPVNLCSARPATNAEFTRELGRQLHRPARLAVPAFVIKRAAGRMAPEVLGSVRVLPQALLDAGFEFADPDIASVLGTALAR